jgi:hypothetical protein
MNSEFKIRNSKFVIAVVVGSVNLALGIVYPFLIYLVAGVAGAYYLYLVARERRILWREGVLLAIAFLIPAPLLLYYASVLATNPVFRVWDAQSITASPPVPHYLLAYGVMLVLAGPTLAGRGEGGEQGSGGAGGMGREGERGTRGRWYADALARWHAVAFLWIWLLVVAVLVYSPLNPQRRFVEGVQVPLAILATIGWFDFYLPRLKQTRAFVALAARPRYSVAGLERLLLVLLLALLTISNVYVVLRMVVTTTLEQPFPLFRERAEVEAVDWIGQNLAPGAVVLSSYEDGSYIASHTRARVVIGHWAETPDFETMYNQVSAFFRASTPDEARREFLRENRVEFVFYGEHERELGDFYSTAIGYLVPVFWNESVKVFRVRW